MAPTEALSIGEVARRAGIQASAIRYYEKVGLLPAPRRSGGQRRYDPGIVDRLALIQFAQQAGFTIAEIHTLFEGFEDATPASQRWQVLAKTKLAETEALIARAEQMKELLGHALACQCLSLDDCAEKMGRSASSSHADAGCAPVEIGIR
jgi:MerR family transcriptional regulator, redox-sensitive transcriptional activator SoxR